MRQAPRARCRPGRKLSPVCVLYVVIGLATFGYLLREGLSGPEHCLRQLTRATAWPVYWPLFNGISGTQCRGQRHRSTSWWASYSIVLPFSLRVRAGTIAVHRDLGEVHFVGTVLAGLRIRFDDLRRDRRLGDATNYSDKCTCVRGRRAIILDCFECHRSRLLCRSSNGLSLNAEQAIWSGICKFAR